MAVRGFDGRPVWDASEVWRAVCAKLKRSGLTEADGHRLGIAGLTGAETAARKLWGQAAYPAMAIPYRDPWTGQDMNGGLTHPWPFIRARCLLDPLPTLPPDKKGKVPRFRKYTQPFNSMVRAYFPALADWRGVVGDNSVPLVITEGELKSACATKNGFPCVGLGGVWNFKSRKYGVELLSELRGLVWEGRSVYVAYDTDPEPNPDVEKALHALTAKLCAAGAEVYQVTLPLLQEGHKTGLDDFIVARGAAEFKKLLAAAERLDSWKFRYQLAPNGQPVMNLNNASIAVRYAPELQDAFAYDEMALVPAVLEPLLEEEDFTPRYLRDRDALAVQKWLQSEGDLPTVSADNVHGAILLCAYDRAFHPIRDGLRRLRWDGVARLDSWLHRYLGAPQDEYTSAVGRMFLVALVARVEEPGCKSDYTLVLEGEQGERKSMILRRLAGEGWFSDQLPKIGEGNEVRLSQHLRGKWLVEIAELGAIRKAEMEDVKKFLTRQVEKYTPLYGRAEAVEPRQCLFVGSTNDKKYLKDDTGNRRWWPCVTGAVDVEGFAAARDQLLAEAFVVYVAGQGTGAGYPTDAGAWWPEREFEKRVLVPEQNERFLGGEWDEDIETWLEEQLKFVAIGGTPIADFKVTSSAVAAGLNITTNHKSSETLRRICGALRRLGWAERKAGGNRTVFTPPPGKSIATPKDTDNVVPLKPKGKKY